MVVDNLEKLLPLLEFDSPDDFYYLQILQRKKENPELGSNSRVIKNYYIRSREQLVGRYEEIKALCTQFNARASLRLNKRSFFKVAFKTLINIGHSMSNKDFRSVGKSYDRACGQSSNETSNKKWIVDIDTQEVWYRIVVEQHIEELQEFTGYKILEILPSKKGWHIITNPFRLDKFRELHPNLDIHKDNPTNLYIP